MSEHVRVPRRVPRPTLRRATRRTALWRRALASAVVLAATGTVLAATPQPARAALPAQSTADPVHYWNDVLQNVRSDPTCGPGPGPALTGPI